VKQTDAQDAKMLVQFLARGPLPEVRKKEALPAESARVLQTRDQPVTLRTTRRNCKVWSQQSPEVEER
jgi:hypothetical protein